MMLAKVHTGQSSIHGTGLFADEYIPKGARLWELLPGVDEVYTKEEAEHLPEPKRSSILGCYFAYISARTGRYVLCGDDARYVNHSSSPTMIPTDEYSHGEEVDVAARDIEPGEEITFDYALFDDAPARKVVLETSSRRG